MLAQELTTMGRDQLRCLIHEGFELRDALLRAEVEGDAHVHVALAEVTKWNTAQLMFCHQCVQIPQVVRQVFRWNCRILPVGLGLPAIGQARHDSRRGLTDAPRLPHFLFLRARGRSQSSDISRLREVHGRARRTSQVEARSWVLDTVPAALSWS